MRKILLTFIVLSQLSCGGTNYFAPMSSKDSDAALLEDAYKLQDKKDYDGVLSKIAEMSPDGQGSEDTVILRASAYGGKCGIDFLDYVDGLDGTGSPFNLFMSGFTGTAINVAHCQTSQDILESAFGITGLLRLGRLGSKRGNNVNTYMAVLGMAKIGTQLSIKVDANRDGADDGTFTNACTQLTNAQVAQVGTGFALILDNFASIAANLSGGSSTVISDLQTTCSTIVPNPCTITSPSDPAWANAAVLNAMKALVRSDTVGIQNCVADGAHPLHPFDCCP